MTVLELTKQLHGGLKFTNENPHNSTKPWYSIAEKDGKRVLICKDTLRQFEISHFPKLDDWEITNEFPTEEAWKSVANGIKKP